MAEIFKCVLFGRPCTGKSSFINLLANGNFNHEAPYELDDPENIGLHQQVSIYVHNRQMDFDILETNNIDATPIFQNAHCIIFITISIFDIINNLGALMTKYQNIPIVVCENVIHHYDRDKIPGNSIYGIPLCNISLNENRNVLAPFEILHNLLLNSPDQSGPSFD